VSTANSTLHSCIKISGVPKMDELPACNFAGLAVSHPKCSGAVGLSLTIAESYTQCIYINVVIILQLPQRMRYSQLTVHGYNCCLSFARCSAATSGVNFARADRARAASVGLARPAWATGRNAALYQKLTTTMFRRVSFTHWSVSNLQHQSAVQLFC
jgi:hypothetical protein